MHIKKQKQFIGAGGFRMSILNDIKKGVKNSGSNKGKVFFVAADTKRRIRFLHDIEDGIEVTVHDSFDKGINVICQKHLGKECPYCGDDGLRHRQSYIWSVFDYDTKEVKLFMGHANNFSPLPSLTAMYESYGTLMDRDYVIQRDGKQMQTRYSVIPMDKVKFKNKTAKPYAKKKAIDILNKAFPADSGDLDDEDDEDNGSEEETIEESSDDYDEMSPKELYMECIERGLKAKKKMKKKYYIDMLVEDDEGDEDEDEDKDDWDNDEEDDEDEW